MGRRWGAWGGGRHGGHRAPALGGVGPRSAYWAAWGAAALGGVPAAAGVLGAAPRRRAA
ncbi:hypothetical protein [Micromonospora sp. URMC 103]|uniref:hypothetical protein n=1 Tax=Micromonospora sp. URMC 103 TaxID=3423406 RepID=UPI003F1E2911